VRHRTQPYSTTESKTLQDEIERVVDALILSSDKSIATPANWPNNHEEAGMKVGGSKLVCGIVLA
jgi:alkyl hydroperoxide reductase subunit AhpC